MSASDDLMHHKTSDTSTAPPNHDGFVVITEDQASNKETLPAASRPEPAPKPMVEEEKEPSYGDEWQITPEAQAYHNARFCRDKIPVSSAQQETTPNAVASQRRNYASLEEEEEGTAKSNWVCTVGTGNEKKCLCFLCNLSEKDKPRFFHKGDRHQKRARLVNYLTPVRRRARTIFANAINSIDDLQDRLVLCTCQQQQLYNVVLSTPNIKLLEQIPWLIYDHATLTDQEIGHNTKFLVFLDLIRDGLRSTGIQMATYSIQAKKCLDPIFGDLMKDLNSDDEIVMERVWDFPLPEEIFDHPNKWSYVTAAFLNVFLGKEAVDFLKDTCEEDPWVLHRLWKFLDKFFYSFRDCSCSHGFRP